MSLSLSLEVSCSVSPLFTDVSASFRLLSQPALAAKEFEEPVMTFSVETMLQLRRISESQRVRGFNHLILRPHHLEEQYYARRSLGIRPCE